MKIIGHTSHGYICEVTKEEMKLSTGKEEPWSAGSHAHPVGNIVNVPEISRHIRNMEYTIKQRKDSAETLRAVANIIETVPDAFTEPDEPKPATPENQI
jgi:hypothetical protein